jgi:hypothetical protein
LDGSNFYSIDIVHHNITLYKKKKKIFFQICLQKTGFFRDFPTLDGSDFYSTSRGDLDTPLYKKKENRKRKIFGLGMGGGPLKKTAVFIETYLSFNLRVLN